MNLTKSAANASSSGTVDQSFRYLPKSEVRSICGIGSDSTLYHLVRTGQFPSPYKLSERLVGWRSDQIESWKLSRKPAQIMGASNG